MTIQLPDAASVAQKIIDKARNERAQYIDGPVDRVMADTPWADREALFSGLIDFHRECLERIPSAEKYPEAKPWVEQRLEIESLLIAAGLSDWDRAVLGGAKGYLPFRGYRLAAKNRRTSSGASGPQLTEKCRVAFLPSTDEGALFMYNADDPATFWEKRRTLQKVLEITPPFFQPLGMVGVGSGMHLDEEPEEIFPLPIIEMCGCICHDLPSAVEFLTRYCDFHSGWNFVLRDREHRSVAVEKCSHRYIDVFYPTVDGRSHVSGMVCRDPNSVQGRHLRAMREEYISLSGGSWDARESLDVAFWDACDLADQILTDFLYDPKPVTGQALRTLFTTPFPGGLRKDGAKFHPKQSIAEYTLINWMALLDKRRLVCYQCDDPPALTWPEEPEVYDV